MFSATYVTELTGVSAGLRDLNPCSRKGPCRLLKFSIKIKESTDGECGGRVGAFPLGTQQRPWPYFRDEIIGDERASGMK